jgi:type I restriction enzyme S subunit
MKTNWQKVRLGDVGKIVTGKTPRTNILDNYGGNIPFLTPSDDLTVKHVLSTKKTLTNKGLAEVKNCLIPPRSICVSCIGSDLGKVVIVTSETVTNQQINSIIPSKDCDSDFLYYSLTILGKELNYISKTSTAVPIINKSTFSDYSIPLPPLPTQRSIAATLSCLDDKIELNNRVNANLEAQAQAIFKSWFVDFEPFKGGGFVDSELGRIPKGWRVVPLLEICEKITKGTTPTTLKRGFTSSGINFIKAESINNDHSFDMSKFAYIDDDTNELLARSIIAKDDILFTMAGTIGRFAYVTDAILPANTNQAVAIIRVNPAIINPEIIYSFFMAEWHKQYYFEKIQQSVQANLSLGNIGSLPLLLPKANELSEYAMTIIPLLDMIQFNNKQSRVLAAIRDALLPRLMSGEIEVEL